MARSATFTAFQDFELAGVEVSDRELGHGSFATVIELEYMGLKCAGKSIHDVLKRQGNDSYSVRRFEDECHLLSRIRHPNIVQFLGVYFQPGASTTIPILVMEFLPTNLTSCIQQYGILPHQLNYSILHDVALGLRYLHGQNPPIIHRDLSSNNILLSTSMTAKISDLGVAKILNMTPLQVSRMTQTPGTPTYMPPEVMVANPRYDVSVDEFSYGILMIHVLSGRWPEPQIGPNRTDPTSDRLIPVTEAARRETFLQAIGNDHPLMNLIHKCLSNNPKRRPHSREIVQELAATVQENPIPFENKMEMMKRIQVDEEEKKSLVAEGKRNAELVQKVKDEIICLKVAHMTEVTQLQLQVDELATRVEALVCEKKTLMEENESFAINLEISTKDYHDHITSTSEAIAMLSDKIVSLKAKTKDDDLQAFLERELARIQTPNVSLRTELMAAEASIWRKNNELQMYTEVVKHKEKIISVMRRQLSKTREVLAAKQQVSITLIFIVSRHNITIDPKGEESM